jgi:hypothetical protein
MMPKILFANNKYAPKILLWHELLFLISLDKRFYLVYISREQRERLVISLGGVKVFTGWICAKAFTRQALPCAK